MSLNAGINVEFNESSNIFRKRKRNSISFYKCNVDSFKKLRQSTEYNEIKKGRKSNDHVCSKKKRPISKQGRFILPNKFLLGGNFKDPLNLNSLSDEKVSAILNAITPIASPIPFKQSNKDVLIPVRIPANIHDPLNLCGQESEDILAAKPRKRRRKRKYYKKNEYPDQSYEYKSVCLSLDKNYDESRVDLKFIKEERKIEDYALRKVADKIVSPVIPPSSPKWKRRRTASECKPDIDLTQLKPVEDGKRFQKSEKQAKTKQPSTHFTTTAQRSRKSTRYRYGNYNNYIGYKNYSYRDARIESLPLDTFDGKEVLDIGCNVGYLSLTIARTYNAKRVVAIDVDDHLISAAKNNLLHCIDESLNESTSTPISFKGLGSLTSHPLLFSPNVEEHKFPWNIQFKKENYVPHSEDCLLTCTKEYDVILALGVTKYIHLNHGDDALIRSLKKMYLQLKPGGCLILQAQQWRAYKKKKRTTEKILEIYKGIHFHPEYFKNYLLTEVGFESCTLMAKINLPHKPQGFQQYILEFKKSSQPTTPLHSDPPLFITNTHSSQHALSSRRSCSTCGSPIQLNESITSCSTCPNTPSIASHPSTPLDYNVDNIEQLN